MTIKGIGGKPSLFGILGYFFVEEFQSLRMTPDRNRDFDFEGDQNALLEELKIDHSVFRCAHYAVYWEDRDGAGTYMVWRVGR